MKKKSPKSKTQPRYNGAYPLAAELVFASRLEKQARVFTDAVYRACLACYRAAARSNAVTNPNNDARDGKDVGIDFVAGERLSKADVKRVRKYLRGKFSGRWSNMTRKQQSDAIKTVLRHAVDVKPVSTGNKRTVAALTSKYGEYGALPAHIIAGVQRDISSNLAKSIAMTEGRSAAAPLAQLSKNAATLQQQIESADFGLTPKYWGEHYQRFTVDQTPLVDLVTGQPVSAETAGAVAPDVLKLAQPVIDLSVISNAPALNAITTDVMNNTRQDFELIVRAADSQRLAPGVELDESALDDLISVDAYASDPQLSADTDRWVAENIGRVKNLSADALKRGIKVTQQAIKEGRTQDWLTDQLTKQMDISAGKAKTIARTATGNANWNASYYASRSAGIRYYRWRGMLDERERAEHVKREGEAYDPEHPPTDGNPGQPINCRCWPEWLYTEEDESEAANEIEYRMAA